MPYKPEITVVSNPEELSLRTAEEFIRRSEESIREKGYFTAALSGGSTPKELYRLLTDNRCSNRIAWERVNLFWSDERCVPSDHIKSNYRMVRELLIDQAPIPKGNIYRMPAELGDHARAAMEYTQTLKTFFHLKAGEFPRFDLILLGMGDDGHTASLFPHTPALDDTGGLVSANYVEKLGEYRLTLTVPLINRAAHIVFLISGESKATVLRDVVEGDYQPHRLPSQFIRPENGRLLFLVDRMAASKLKEKSHG
ncbi:MAG: 6-phosphogluconolactonase [Planctomycetota bacterium]|mgnify:FL=1